MVDDIKLKQFFFIFVVFLSACSSNDYKSQGAVELIRKADLQYKRGLLSEAEALYRKVLEDVPTYYEAWLKLGNIFVRTGQLESAINAYEQCIRLEENNVKCWNNLSLARVKQAMAVLEEGQQHFPEGSGEFNSLISLYGRLIDVLSPR